MTKKKSSTSTVTNQDMFQRDEDLPPKGKVEKNINPPWAVNPKGKSGARDMGHRNRP